MAITPGIMWGAALPPRWHGRDLEAAELFALLRGLGVEAIDVFARHVDHYGTEALRVALDDSGLRCSCYYVQGDLLAEGEERIEVERRFAAGVADAASLGSPLVFTYGTQHAHEGPGALSRYIERLGEKAADVRAAGMTLVIENAGRMLRSAGDLLAVATALGADGPRLCPDTGNFSIWRFDELEAVRRCLPWMAHIHLKDLSAECVGDQQGRGVPDVLGRGVTPIAAIVAMLHAAGWEGVAAWEPGPRDEDGVEAGVAELMRLVG